MRTLLCLILLMTLVGCGASPKPAASPINGPLSEDRAALEAYLTLPGPPTAVKWRLSGETSDRGIPNPELRPTLVALLAFDAATLAQIRATAGPPISQDPTTLPGMVDLAWLPASITSTIQYPTVETQTIGLPRYAAAQFDRADSDFRPLFWFDAGDERQIVVVLMR